MPKSITQRLTALEKTIAKFFGVQKTRAKKATKKAKSKSKRVIKNARKSVKSACRKAPVI
jgi:hypothetical protein